ncbi:hypothetical protein QVD99_003577 [Batrachochytrium dendrobatidis]|nr:hypothetical protein O5D80_003888 [Batrachochytrium dendrobatidis]KAK5669167.1 hypothetical protein QVD99_003577 [Batrachochytrium dendrobatidis]
MEYNYQQLLPTNNMETDPVSFLADQTIAVGKGARNKSRVTQACDLCSKKKSKCDGAKPLCSNCVSSDTPCTYTRNPKRRGPPPGYFSSVMHRLKQLEAKIANADKNSTASTFNQANAMKPNEAKNKRNGYSNAERPGVGPVSDNQSEPGLLSQNSKLEADSELLLSKLEAHFAVLQQSTDTAPEAWRSDDPHMSGAHHSNSGNSIGGYSKEGSSHTYKSERNHVQSLYQQKQSAPMQVQVHLHGLSAYPFDMSVNHPAFRPHATVAQITASNQATLNTPLSSCVASVPLAYSNSFDYSTHYNNITDTKTQIPAQNQTCSAVSLETTVPLEPVAINSDRLDFLANSFLTDGTPSLMAPTITTHASSSCSSSNAVPNAQLIYTFLDWFNPRVPIFNRCALIRNLETLPPCLIHIMCALACTFSQLDGLSTYNAGDQHYFAAKNALDDELELPTPWIIATTILLAYYSAGSGRGTSSTLFIAAGLRIAQLIRLDKKAKPSNDSQESTEERDFYCRLWSQLIEADFYFAFSTSMPFLINDNLQKRVCSLETRSSVLPDMSTNTTPTNGTSASGILSDESLAWFDYSANDTQPFQIPSQIGQSCGETNVWTQMAKLQGLARRVILFFRATSSNSECASKMDPKTEALERTSLDLAMQAYYNQLPFEMKAISNEYSMDPLSISPPSWRIAYLQCLTNFIQICIHSSIIPKLTESSGQVQIPATHPAIIKTRNLAYHLSDLFKKFLETNPFFHHVPPFIGRIIYHTALVYVLLMRCTDANVVELNGFVDMSVQALKNMGTWYLPCIHEAKVVETFRAFPFRSIKTSQCPKM